VFQALTSRLEDIFSSLRRRGKVSEQDIKTVMREVKLALLEADVNFKVVKEFVKKVRERALGQEVMQSLTPAQQVIKVVRDELVVVMGSTVQKLDLGDKRPAVLLLVGLNGSGKTTTCAKLAVHLQSKGNKPLMVAADIYRPAAIKQLQVLGEQSGIPVFQMGEGHKVVDIVKAALRNASAAGNDVVLVDSAGRLHVNEELMQELEGLIAEVPPSETLLVADATTGQDAVNVATEFNRRLAIDGTVLTKLDGDARGGAALSIRAVTGKPIKFVGLGEKIDAIEPFYPDRMASRILGMGDILTLIDKVETTVDQEKARELEQKLRKMDFSLQDFLEQLQQMKKLGPLDQLMDMVPGFSSMARKMKGFKVDDRQLKRIEAIILSMTPGERNDPGVICGSRRRRIASGSGTTVSEINRLLKQFQEMKKLMKKMTSMTGPMKLGPGMFPFG